MGDKLKLHVTTGALWEGKQVSAVIECRSRERGRQVLRNKVMTRGIAPDLDFSSSIHTPVENNFQTKES